MSKMPPIPPEQRSFTGDKTRDRLRSAEPGLRDDDADHHLSSKSHGQSANIRQTAHHQQDR
jgi:hypothetical protein